MVLQKYSSSQIIAKNNKIVRQVNSVARGWKNYFYYGGCRRKKGQNISISKLHHV